MYQFSGNVVLLANEFRTYQELIHAALDQRTFSSNGALNTQLRNEEKSRWRAQTAGELFLGPGNLDLYEITATKGVVNGITTQSAFASADFTNAPGGGNKLTAGDSKRFGHRVELGGRVLYSGNAACTFNLDCTCY